MYPISTKAHIFWLDYAISLHYFILKNQLIYQIILQGPVVRKINIRYLLDSDDARDVEKAMAPGTLNFQKIKSDFNSKMGFTLIWVLPVTEHV